MLKDIALNKATYKRDFPCSKIDALRYAKSMSEETDEVLVYIANTSTKYRLISFYSPFTENFLGFEVLIRDGLTDDDYLEMILEVAPRIISNKERPHNILNNIVKKLRTNTKLSIGSLQYLEGWWDTIRIHNKEKNVFKVYSLYSNSTVKELHL